MADRNTVTLYGEIGVGKNTSPAFKERIAAADPAKPLRVLIDTVGGSVLDGIGIRDAMKAWPAGCTAVVEPAALSIGSYLLTGADRVEMSSNGYIMVHRPRVAPDEMNDDELMRAADLVRSMKNTMVSAYCQRTGKSEQEILDMLEMDTWIDGPEALAMGLVDALIDPSASRVLDETKMPAKVVASLKVSGTQGGTKVVTKETPMATANLAKTLRAKFGTRVSAEFLVKAMELEMDEGMATEELIKQLMGENEVLSQAKAALEQENSDLKKQYETMQAQAAAAATPTAKQKGVTPVARAANPGSTANTGVSAKERWNAAVKAKIELGIPHANACKLVNRENPGLREEMLTEINS